MRVLMFGWEFPPYNSGGLGTACQGLTKGLAKYGAEVIFVLPRKYNIKANHIKIISPDTTLENINVQTINSLLKGYDTVKSYEDQLKLLEKPKRMRYGRNLFEEVELYAKRAATIAKKENHDVIHAHDWLTYKAGMTAKRISNKHFIAHVHATEFDRSGGYGNPHVHKIEYEGLQAADRIITVSNLTKEKIIKEYGINPQKVRVIHNGVEFEQSSMLERSKLNDDNKIVLFLGRVTLQKGPDYFVYAARKVLDYYPKALFMIVGNGDMEGFVMKKVLELNMANKFLFAGFLRGRDVTKAFQMADVFVMPSVSEPFGLVPLESMMNGTPAIISKQSGVSEVLINVLKADFWDINELANKIVSVLKYEPLHKCLRENGLAEVKKFNWDEPAKKTLEVYREVMTL